MQALPSIGLKNLMIQPRAVLLSISEWVREWPPMPIPHFGPRVAIKVGASRVTGPLIEIFFRRAN